MSTFNHWSCNHCFCYTVAILFHAQHTLKIVYCYYVVISMKIFLTIMRKLFHYAVVQLFGNCVLFKRLHFTIYISQFLNCRGRAKNVTQRDAIVIETKSSFAKKQGPPFTVGKV